MQGGVISFIRPNDTLRKKQTHLCAPKFASFFFLPVSDGLIKDMSSPDRACLLTPRDVLFALTFLETVETMGFFAPASSSPVGALPCALVGVDPELPSGRSLPVAQSSPLRGQTHYWGALVG